MFLNEDSSQRLVFIREEAGEVYTCTCRSKHVDSVMSKMKSNKSSETKLNSYKEESNYRFYLFFKRIHQKKTNLSTKKERNYMRKVPQLLSYFSIAWAFILVLLSVLNNADLIECRNKNQFYNSEMFNQNKLHKRNSLVDLEYKVDSSNGQQAGKLLFCFREKIRSHLFCENFFLSVSFYYCYYH